MAAELTSTQIRSISAIKRYLMLATLTFTTMLYTMTVMIANVALPKIQGTFAATQDQIALIITFNIVATAVVTPASGWLASRFSRRNLLICCVSGFIVSSTLCGASQTLEQLIVFRILQGGFGAPLVPISMAMVLDTFDKSEHGTVSAIYGMGVVFGPIIGPTVGGFLSEELGWRWVFFLLVPFGIIVLLAIISIIDDKSKSGSLKLDWTGLISLCIGIGALQLMLDRGQRLDWFSSYEIIIELIITIAALYIFLVHIFTTNNPFINFNLFLNKNYLLGLLIMFLFGTILWTPLIIYPPMMQKLQGYPEDITGLFLALRGLGTLCGSTLLVFINKKVDPRLILSLGFFLQGMAGMYMANFDINLSAFELAWTNTLAGFGVGFVWVPLTLITFSTLENKYLNEGNAFWHLIRNIGSSISISITIALIIRSTAINYEDLSHFVSIFGDSNSIITLKGANSPNSTSDLFKLSSEINRQSSMIGYINAFHLYYWIAFAIIPIIMLVRLPSKRMK